MTTKILSLLCFFSQLSFAQEPTIAGTWKLVKHITTIGKDKNVDCLPSMKGTTVILKINRDGSYEENLHLPEC